MKAKIILCSPGNTETLVATVKSDIEAFQCASLLQALTNSENYLYYVEHHVKGKGKKRSRPTPFTIVIGNSTHLFSLLKPLYLTAFPL